MKNAIVIFLSLFLVSGLAAQGTEDALRYSYWTYGGSARFAGTGGSLGALGGDYSAILSNPASLAAYRRSELTFTPGFRYSGVETQIENEATLFTDNRITGNVNQAAIVFAKGKPGTWKTANFSIGYSRLADFNNRYSFISDSNGSIVDYFVELSDGVTPDALNLFDTALAYDAWLTDLLPNSDDTYIPRVQAPGQTITKFQTVQEKGSMGELNMAFAGNINHKVYVGASIGIPILDFTQNKTYQEVDANGTITGFENLTFRESLNTSGAGFNINLGLIFRVNQALRIGGAFHSPTWLALSDSYFNTMETNIVPGDGSSSVPVNYYEESPQGIFEYNLQTPMRLVGNMGYIIGKKGFVSAEIEWVDYRRNTFNFNNGSVGIGAISDEAFANNRIEELFRSTVNVRLGGEYVLAEDYRLRAGYSLFGNPYVDDADNFSMQQFSLGMGYRMKRFFLDLAYTYQANSDYFYRPYTGGSIAGPLVRNKLDTHQILATLGFKF